MVRIAQIEAGSIAEELHLEIGSRIVRINGHRVRDGIDLTYLLSDTDLELETVSPPLPFEINPQGDISLDTFLLLQEGQSGFSLPKTRYSKS